MTFAKQLKESSFSGQVLDTGSPDFTTASRRFSALSESKASLIAFPESAKDISLAITFGNACGGHLASGANSVEDGLVIDLSKWKFVEVAQDKKSVHVAGGCLWGDVYTELDAHGLECVGGGAHVVGVGGHLTGGGFGPLTHKYGMACDNILSAQVVLADGQIVTASQNENKDLLWAIKGGSSQFGVVAEFTLRTFPKTGPYYFRSIGFLPEDFETFIPLYEDFITEKRGWEFGMLVFLTYVRKQPEGQPLLVANITGVGSISDHEELFDFLFGNINIIFDKKKHCPSLIEVSHALDDLLLGGPRRIATGSTAITSAPPGLLQNLWDRWLDYTNSNPDSTETKIIIELHGTKRRRPELSCSPIRETAHQVLISEEHNKATGDGKALDWVHSMLALIRLEHSRHTGKDLGINVNAAMPNENINAIWGTSLTKLRHVKAKYDPNCVFDRIWHIKPEFHPVNHL